MLKSELKTCMVEEASQVKQLSLNQPCKIGLNQYFNSTTDTRKPRLVKKGAFKTILPGP
jgi:hypothetical protein